jgi:hypothetical protein
VGSAHHRFVSGVSFEVLAGVAVVFGGDVLNGLVLWSS